MKRNILILLVLLSTTLSAQIRTKEKINGKVVTSTNGPVEFAEIILIAKDSTAVKSQLTNEKGDFVLVAQVGWYKLQIRQAQKILFSKDIELNSDLDLGIITVDNVTQLELVTVVGKKRLVERKVDRLVFNVENSINASGSDAFEALKITPGVKVQNDKITIIGKSTLAVMIDDKIVQLSEDDLANYLKSIPSDVIKSIEVFTTPPAKYEAAGNSGLVNIKLKKTKENSWNALLGSTYIQRTYSDASLMGSFNYNKNRLSISSSFNYRKGAKLFDQYGYTYFPDGLWYNSTPDKVSYVPINVMLGIDYKISPKWTLGSRFLINNNKITNTSNSYTPVYDYTTGQTTRYINSDDNTVQNPIIKSLNIYNEFNMDTLGRKVTLNLDYFNFDNKDNKAYNGISVIEIPNSRKYFSGLNNNDQSITNLSGKLDIDYPLKWAKLSFGGKASTSKSNNGISYFNSGFVDFPVSELPLTQNKFEYTENIQAAYISGNKKINAHWESQLGLRMETTQSKTFSANLNQSTKNNYIKFFPTAYLSFVPNDNSRYTLSYSRRIARPSFHDLNPNIYYINPYQTVEGNPFLQPSFSNNAELTYTYKKLESKFYFSYEDNMFSQLPIVDPQTTSIRYTNENFISTQRYGISENYIFDKFDWWTSNNAIDLNYSISKSSLSITQEKQKGFNSRVSTNNDFTLNSKKTLFFNLMYWYSAPGIDGIYKAEAMSSLSVAIQYLLLNKDLKISLKGDDLFRTQKYNTTTRVNGILQVNKSYYDNQSFQVSVSYRFGNKKIKVEQRRTGNEDERKRTGS